MHMHMFRPAASAASPPAPAKRLFCWRLITFAVLIAGAGAGPAAADCTSFAWPIEQERRWFAAEAAGRVAPGGTLTRVPDGAIVIEPVPVTAVSFVHAPGRGVPPDSRGAVVFVSGLSAGIWQITLSAPAWIDVVQNGKLLPSVAHTGDHSGTCGGVRKSVRFETGEGPAAIQLSGAPEGPVRLALRRAG